VVETYGGLRFRVKENGELSRSLFCGGKGKIVGITLIPVISTHGTKFEMIRVFEKLALISSLPEIIRSKTDSTRGVGEASPTENRTVQTYSLKHL